MMPSPAAGFAPPALDVEGEAVLPCSRAPSRPAVAANTSRIMVKQPGVRRRIRTRRAPDRASGQCRSSCPAAPRPPCCQTRRDGFARGSAPSPSACRGFHSPSWICPTAGHTRHAVNSAPSGTFTSMFFRLFSCAPRYGQEALRLTARVARESRLRCLPDRYCPVIDCPDCP